MLHEGSMKIRYSIFIVLFSIGFAVNASAQESFNGLHVGMHNLYMLSNAQTRSIGPENRTGAKGKGGMATLENGSAANAARELGQGWKVNPYIVIQPGKTDTLADIEDSGAIQHIWMTPSGAWRSEILRIYWDGEKTPSVEVSVGDFFASGWQKFKQISSLAVTVNPGSGLNCYWVMPFHKKCVITMENTAEKHMVLYYQIDYTLTKVPKDAGYFHAEFHRENPVPYKKDYTIVDHIRGKGQYVGTYMAFQTTSNGWWGEGEIKFYIDGDTKFPTINGTGTEDYFCGSYGFMAPDKTGKRVYTDFTTPYVGFSVIRPELPNQTETRFNLYRWHITDPVRFNHDLKVTIQDLGWQSGGRYRPRQDDIATVAYWYQTEPHNPLPPLPGKDVLEIH